LLYLVGYLHRCTKVMHGHTNIKFVSAYQHCDNDGKRSDDAVRR